jgi:hypothetical protein
MIKTMDNVEFNIYMMKGISHVKYFLPELPEYELGVADFQFWL